MPAYDITILLEVLWSHTAPMLMGITCMHTVSVSILKAQVRGWWPPKYHVLS